MDKRTACSVTSDGQEPCAHSLPSGLQRPRWFPCGTELFQVRHALTFPDLNRENFKISITPTQEHQDKQTSMTPARLPFTDSSIHFSLGGMAWSPWNWDPGSGAH